MEGKEIGELLIKLIEFKTTSLRIEELRKAVDFVEEYLRDIPVQKIRYERNGKPSIVYSLQPTRKPKILFVAHLDVVDADPEDFVPKWSGGVVRGRGALDDKGPAALLIILLKELYLKGKNYPISFMLTTDEEVGSKDGVEYLLSEEKWECEFAVIPDGGKNFSVILESKGVLHLILKGEGKSVHGSRPWEGENAIEKLMRLYQLIKEDFPVEPCGDPDHWHNTINLGRISGGDSVNRVPDKAEIHLDLRFVSPWTVDRMKHMIRKKMEKFEGVEMEIVSSGEVVSTPKENSFVRNYRKVAERILGREIEFSKEHGATDGRFFAEREIPVLITYPRGGGAHSREEWVDVDSLAKLGKIFTNFLQEVFEG